MIHFLANYKGFSQVEQLERSSVRFQKLSFVLVEFALGNGFTNSREKVEVVVCVVDD